MRLDPFFPPHALMIEGLAYLVQRRYPEAAPRGRFERASLQYRTPLDDSVIEQFEHQAKSRQSNFISKVL